MNKYNKIKSAMNVKVLTLLTLITMALSGCDNLLVKKSLSCTEIIIVKIYSYNPATHKGLFLLEGDTPEFGHLKRRTLLPTLPAITSSLKNGLYFHVLAADSDLIFQNLGEDLTPVCWFYDTRFQTPRFYIRAIDG